MTPRLYFDYAAATPLDEQVTKVMDDHRSSYSNPSARYASARESKKILDQSRKQIAILLNSNKDEIVFTHSSTESNNLALFGVCHNFDSGRIISIRTEHPSVYEPLVQLQEEGYQIDWCDIDKYGRVDLNHLSSLIKPDTILVTIQYANSMTGTIQPVSKISSIINQARKDSNASTVFHVDATGAQPSSHIAVDRLGADLITLSSSKIYGPACALLYVKRGTNLKPLIYGGKQEYGLRAGTEDIRSIVGFASAMQILDSRCKQDATNYEKLYRHFIDGLSKKTDFVTFGHPKERIYNVANIAFDNINGEDLVAYLDAMGVEVSTGAACLANNEKPTRILLAMGVDESLAQGSLRISFGRETTIQDVDILIESLHSTVNKLRK